MTARRHSRSTSAIAAVAAAFIVVPLASVIWRTPFSDIWSVVSSTASLQALRVSLQTSVVSALVSCVLGVPLAWWLARSGSRLVRTVRTLSIAPMVLPPVVGGIALLTAFGRRGVVGEPLDEWFGVTVPFTAVAVVMAQVFVSMPFLVISVEAAFRQAGTDLEDAARTLGARPNRVFWQVALPAARPALAAGAMLAWARSLGEFGATITFAGSLPGRTQTLPMAVYEYAAVDYRQSLVLSLVLIVISVGVLLSLRDRWIGAVTR
ncbi:MAG: ABC transporter permease [Ilumatobacteraceae bacterium]